MISSFIEGTVRSIVTEADRVTRKLTDPLLLGPKASLYLRRITRWTLYSAFASAITSPATIITPFPYNLVLPTTPILLLILSYTMPRLWRLLVGYGLSREIPSLLSYALPYSSGPRYLADVLAKAPREYFPWFSWEADRLGFLLNLGYDPISALKGLALTTPSRRLREILLDYIHSHEIGSPRSQVTLKLLEGAVNEARSQWKAYVDLGRGVIEALTVMLMASIILAPLSLLSGSQAPVNGAMLLTTLIAPVFTTLLVATRPGLGELEVGLHYSIGALVAAMAASAITYVSGIIYGLIFVTIMGIIYEVFSRNNSVLEERSLAALREVSTGAKYGRFLEEELKRALPVASRTLRALIDAMTYAGKIGVAEAVSHILRVIESAKESVASARGQGLVLTIVAALIPSVSIYIIRTIVDIGSTASMPGIEPASLGKLTNIVLAMSPLVPLPATVLWRGRIPSLLPSLFALTASYLALHL